MLCDICGAKLPEQLTLFVPTGTSWNGVESEVDGKHVDLCHAHLHAMVKGVLKPERVTDYDLGKRMVGWYANQKRSKTSVC